MTMFSMKPKFDLAAFLAEPAKPGASRRRNTMKSARPPLRDEEEAIDESEVRSETGSPSA
jgi:hypothetical protein